MASAFIAVVEILALTLSIAENGHLQLIGLKRTTRFGPLWLRIKLQIIYGFRREGSRIVGGGEAIAPDFVRGGIRLHAGWDDYSGYYLLSTCDAGDAFLRQLAGH